MFSWWSYCTQQWMKTYRLFFSFCFSFLDFDVFKIFFWWILNVRGAEKIKHWRKKRPIFLFIWSCWPLTFFLCASLFEDNEMKLKKKLFIVGVFLFSASLSLGWQQHVERENQLSISRQKKRKNSFSSSFVPAKKKLQERDEEKVEEKHTVAICHSILLFISSRSWDVHTSTRHQQGTSKIYSSPIDFSRSILAMHRRHFLADSPSTISLRFMLVRSFLNFLSPYKFSWISAFSFSIWLFCSPSFQGYMVFLARPLTIPFSMAVTKWTMEVFSLGHRHNSFVKTMFNPIVQIMSLIYWHWNRQLKRLHWCIGCEVRGQCFCLLTNIESDWFSMEYSKSILDGWNRLVEIMGLVQSIDRLVF